MTGEAGIGKTALIEAFRQRLEQVLRRYAPSWLAQLPTILPETEAATVQPREAGATRERMLWELATTLEALSGLWSLCSKTCTGAMSLRLTC